jgi:hypothetical protein
MDMGLTYTGTNGLFTHLGKLVKHYNQFASDGLDADRDEILAAFQASGMHVTIDGLVGAYQRWKTEYVDRRSELVRFALMRLTDRETVLDELGAASADPDEVLRKLLEAMDEDGATVQASSVALGSVAVDGDNAGGGILLTTDVLDGVSSPGAVNGVRFPAQVKYDGVTTELAAASQRLTFRVVSDSFHDDLDEGNEQIEWQGLVQGSPHGIGPEGSGAIGVLLPVHAQIESRVANADFESFTDDVPDGWELVGGAAGTNVLAAGAAQAAHGSDALLFRGNATASSIEIKQDIPRTSVVARRRYCLTVKLKREAATTGTLTIQFEGTGYSAGTGEKVSAAVSSLGASYQLHHFFLTMPPLIPDDFQLVIRWDGGTPGSGEKVYIDDLGFGPVHYGAGIGVVAVRDSGPLVREDRFELTVTNTEGVFQSFFRRALGVQLPSAASSPTIADSLAE